MLWHRISCVYCGRRTDEPPPYATDAWRRSPLACWRHVRMLASDPVYALDDRQRVKGKGSR